MKSPVIIQPIKTPKTALRIRLRRYLFGVTFLGALAALSCTQGSYPVDIFYEMHYQQSYKSGEPPRLSAPESSVAWYPPPKATAFGAETGEHLYSINCSMCHGNGGQGDGPVVQNLKVAYGYKPVIDPPIITDNPIDNIVLILQSQTRFFGPDSVMPPFGRLLSDEERLAIAEYVHTLPEARPAPADEGEPTPTPTPTPKVSKEEQQPVPSGDLEVGVNGDVLEFDTDRLEVSAGSEVVLVFSNGSIINQHNLVIVQVGQKDLVSNRGAVAGPGNDWIEPGDSDVIANVKLLNPGETGEVRFTAPLDGAYQFVCTFPGHNVTMFGDFVVTPQAALAWETVRRRPTFLHDATHIRPRSPV